MPIADHGRRETAARKEATARKILDAMREIEKEVDTNGGLYPYNDGRLSQQELLRRAGVNGAALQKPTHSDLRTRTNAWLRQIKYKATIGAKSVRAEVTDRIRAKDEELKRVKQRWAEAELQYLEEQREASEIIAKQSQRISELEEQLASRRSRRLHLVPSS